MLDIQESERTGKSGRTYKQYFLDGKLVGCGCDQAVALAPYGNKPCCHMTGRKALVMLEVSQEPATPRPSCELCGRETRGIFPICWICAGA